MSFNRCAAVLAAALFTSAAAAQDWPARAVRIVVPFAPGGTTDILARLIAADLNSALGQPITIDNRAGAGGNIGAAEVAKSAPDGYTFLMGTPGTQAINQFIYLKMPYDTERDLIPVSYVASVPNVVVAHPSLGFKTMADLVAHAKTKPGSLNSASPGNGSTGHLSLELLKRLAGGIAITHIPYKGSGPALNDLLGGQVQMTIDNLPSAMPHIQSGKLTALAVTSTARVATLPNVPTVAESIAGYAAESWFVLVAPRGTPETIVRRLSAEVDRALKRPAIAEKMQALGAEPVGGTPEFLGRHIAAEIKKWREVVKASGAKVD